MKDKYRQDKQMNLTDERESPHRQNVIESRKNTNFH